VLTTVWDALGNVIMSCDGETADVAQYCGTGVVAKRTLPDGSEWRFGYDILERLREVKNPRGESCRFRYDAVGRVVEQRAFDGQVTRYQYGKDHLLARVEHMDDTWRAFEYDPIGQRVAETNPHSNVRYERNDVGWIVKATVEEYFGEVVTEVAYDADG